METGRSCDLFVRLGSSSMRCWVVTLLFVSTLGGASPTFADDEHGAITGTANFMMSAAPVGDRHGLLAPGGHLDVGFGVRRWRLAAETDLGLWSEPTEADTEPASRSGSFRRLGMALRLRMKERRFGGEGRPRAALGIYLETGLGQQRIALPEPTTTVTRSDVMLGLGTDLIIGSRARFGGNFGVRALISREPEPEVEPRGLCARCGRRGYDVAFLYTFGFRFGR